MKTIVKHVISWVGIFSVLFSLPLNVKAETETTVAPTTTVPGEVVEASDLIFSYYGYCTSSSNKLYISAYVSAFEVMAEIGFIDFEIQRSTTGTGNWTSTS